MRKVAWFWVIIAFIIGLAPGVALFAWQRSSSLAVRQQLLTRNASLRQQNQALDTQRRSAEASVSVLAAKLETAQTPPPGIRPQTGTTVATGPVSVTSRSVTPAQASRGANLTLKIEVTGAPDKVDMRIVGPGFDKTYYLAKASTQDGGQTWTKEIAAPSAAGTYRFYGLAFAAGKKYTMPGTVGFTFTVK